MVSEFKAKITKINDESPTTKTFVLKVSEKTEAKPGQFIMVTKKEWELGSRAYSLSKISDFEIEITVKKMGSLTTKLFELKIDEELECKGPYGKFVFLETDEPVLFIAGGTGIAPLRSMLCFAANNLMKNDFYLFYSAKTEEEILFKEEIEQMKEKILLKTSYTATEESGERINKTLLEKKGIDFENSFAYICGSKEMADDVSEMLLELGMHRERVRTEKW